MDEIALFEFLDAVADGGVGELHHKGYEWVLNTLYPALNRASKIMPHEKFLISDCYYILGDIHDFNNAPKAAINAYQKSLAFDPEFSGAYRELSGMYRKMGNYQRAMELIEKACFIDPEDEDAIIDREKLDVYLVDPGETPFKSGDLIWALDETLATGKFQDSTALVEQFQDNIEHYKAKARYYGALFDEENYLKQWLTILKLNQPFGLQFSDWFYMPKSIYNNLEIWEIFLALHGKILPGIFISFDSLFLSQRFKNLPKHLQHKLEIEFQIYSVTENITKLKELQVIYPEWIELQKEIEKLEQQN